MISILLTILAFNVLIVIFKFYDRFKVDNLQALIVNYIVAGGLSIYFSAEPFKILTVVQEPWIYHSIAIGILFIVVFNFYAFGTQKVGIAVTTIANKLSLIIPVAVALVLYPDDHLTILKAAGFVLAILGIYFSSTKSGKLAFDVKYLWLIILVFVGQGLADSIFNHAQHTVVNESEKHLFFTVLFIMAALSGILILLGKSIVKKPQLQFKNLIGGIALGVPNYLSLIFFFNALENSSFHPSQVFPIVSMGVVALSAIIGLLFFKEKLTTFNWVGIVLSLLAILLVSLN